jgi:hypothetical protein
MSCAAYAATRAVVETKQDASAIPRNFAMFCG